MKRNGFNFSSHVYPLARMHLTLSMMKWEDMEKKVAVIHGERAWKAAREYVVPALEKAGLTITTEWLYGHDATHENADKISNDPAVQEADMLLAVGGGKCIDTAKLAADHLGKPVFTAPSIASNCAPVTQISIMYHEDGSFCDIPRLKEVPVHCFINPKLVLAAPVKYLWAGIGDAMAKHVESSWSAKAGEKLSFGSEFGITAGQMCFYPMVKDAKKAMDDAKAGRNSEELENTILNIVVSPGVVICFCSSKLQWRYCTCFILWPDQERAY